MAFCSKCGTQTEDAALFCPSCGQTMSATAAPQQAAPPPPPPQPAYTPPQPAYQAPAPAYSPYVKPPKPPHYAPGSFTEMLHNHAEMTLFLIAICLFSAGAFMESVMSFSWTTIFTWILLAVPITGMWILFAASKSPKLPEKARPAMTLFKASFIVELVLTSISALGFLLIAILAFIAGAALMEYGGGGVVMAIAVFLLLIAAGVIVYIVFYFKAALSIVHGLRNGIEYNSFAPLPNVKTFTILAYIGIGAAVFAALAGIIATFALRSIMNELLYEILYELDYDMRQMIEPSLRSALGFETSSVALTFGVLFTLAKNAGIVILIVMLNQFNDKLQARYQPQMQQPVQQTYAPPPQM